MNFIELISGTDSNTASPFKQLPSIAVDENAVEPLKSYTGEATPTLSPMP